MASENEAIEQHYNIAGANSIGGTAIGQYSPSNFLLEGEYDGIDATSWAGKGAIDPFAKQSNGLTCADGIGCAAVGLYPPPMVVEVGGEYFVLPQWCSNEGTFPINAACVNGPDGCAVRVDAYAGWYSNAIEGWEGGHRGDWCEPLSQGTS